MGLNKTAKNVCEELAEKLKVPATKLILEEVILNNNLSRPVHYEEKVNISNRVKLNTINNF